MQVHRRVGGWKFWVRICSIPVYIGIMLRRLQCPTHLLVITLLMFPTSGYPMDEPYRIQEEIRLPAINNLGNELPPDISGAKEFSEILVNSYFDEIRKEVPAQFRNDPGFWRASHVSVKVVFSTFAESLLYLYPDDKNRFIADIIPLPTQLAFLAGLINFSSPTIPTDTSSIKLFVSTEEAIKHYSTIRTSIITEGVRIGVAGSGGVRFVNTAEKMITFRPNSIFGFFGGWIEVENTDPAIASLYGKPVHFRFETLGPLLFNGEKSFAWAKEGAKTIAVSMAESGIKNFFTKSEFFKQALAHEKLKPQADKIIKMKARADQDPSFEYPLWKFKQDWEILKDGARLQGFDPDYLEALRLTAPSGAGYLFWYYPTHSGFIWQWAAANATLLAFITILLALRTSDALPPSILSFFQSAAFGKPILPFIIISVNAYIFAAKPSSLVFNQWIGPGLIFLVSMILSIL